MYSPRDDDAFIGSSATARTIPAPPCLSWRWPVGCLIAVLYASLLPFDFSATTLYRAISGGFLSLRFRSTTPDDAAANLLVYLAVGFVLGLYAARNRCGRWAGTVLAVAVGATLSILVETLQTGLESRVASCTDILLNCIGTALGACLGIGLSASIGAAIAQVRRELADRPFTTAASLMTLGLFLYNLAPFDFVTNTDALHAAFGRAQWGLIGDRHLAVGAPPFAAMAHQLTGAAWFALLGYLLALSGRERDCHLTKSLGLALKEGLILVALVEFMQLFTHSHTFDAATILIRSLGVVIGAWCALFLIDSLSGSAWLHRPSLALPTGVLAILAVVQIGLLIAPCLNPQITSPSSERPFAVQWLPFEILWRQSLHKAAAEVLSSLLTLGALALTIRALLQRTRTAYAGWWTFVAMTTAVTACEGLRLISIGTPLDVTTPVMAWVAVYIVAERWSNRAPVPRPASS